MYMYMYMYVSIHSTFYVYMYTLHIFVNYFKNISKQFRGIECTHYPYEAYWIASEGVQNKKAHSVDLLHHAYTP